MTLGQVSTACIWLMLLCLGEVLAKVEIVVFGELDQKFSTERCIGSSVTLFEIFFHQGGACWNWLQTSSCIWIQTPNYIYNSYDCVFACVLCVKKYNVMQRESEWGGATRPPVRVKNLICKSFSI